MRGETNITSVQMGGVQSDLGVKVIDYGCTDCGDVESNNFKDYNIYFNKAFPSKPIVTANVAGTYTPVTEVTGVSIVHTTTSYFTIRVRNQYRTALNVKINWIAVL